MNRFTTISNFFVRLSGSSNTNLGVGKYLIGIFSARIIRSEDDNIAQASCCFTHRRALGRIAIAAAAEQRNDSPFSYFPRCAQHIQQSVIAVSVINYYGEVSKVGHSFKAARRAGAFAERLGNYFQAVAECQPSRDRSQGVVNMWRANQRRVEVSLVDRSTQTKSHSVERELSVGRGNVGLRLHAIANYAQAISLQTFSQLDTFRIVHVDDGSFWPRAEASVEETLLCIPVILHRLVIVEVVAREIAENCHRVIQAITTMKIHRLRRTLHHRGSATGRDCLSQKTLHVRCFWSGAVSLGPLVADAI